MNSFFFFFTCLWVFATIQLAHGAEWSKLKKCSDLGFCRRHRHYTAPIEFLYKVSAETLKITTWRGQSALTGSVSADERHPLLFAVTAFANGIYRIVIDDDANVKHARHVVKDVLMPHVEPLQLEDNLLYVDIKHAQLMVHEFPVKVIIHYDPFRIDVVRIKDETIITSFNAQSKLLVDAFQEKPTPSPSPSPLAVESSGDVIDEMKSDTGEEGEDPVTSKNDAADDDASENEDELEIDDEYDEEDEYDEGDVEDPESELPEEDSTDEGKDQVDDVKLCDGCWDEKFQSHNDPKLRGPESVGVDVSFPFATHLYGIPERTARFALTNTIGAEMKELSEPYRMYNLDVFEFELEKPLGLYGAIPFIVARRQKDSAGLLWLNSAETYVDILESGETGRNTHWYSETGMIDVYVMTGPTSNHVHEQYLWLTGTPAMPQRFSLGYHQCRWNYRDDEDARTVDAEFDAREIPYDVLWLDIEHTDGKRYFTWDMERFPDPTGLQNHIAARGRKMVTIIDPHVKRDNKYSLHRLAQEQNLYVKKPDGKPYDGWCWPGSSSYFDVTCPRVREVWAGRFNPTDYPHFTEHLYTWNDMNEPSVFNGPEGTMPKDVIHDGNVEHRHIHNIYGHYFMQATFEGLRKGHGGNDRPFVLSRSFFAGSQRYGAIWTGDNTAAWDHLESGVGMLLALQITGMPFSGADVGGFFGNPAPELLTRWYQAAAFQPFFRGHAHLDTNRREPWLFGEPFTTHISNAIRTRYNYLPLWYTLFAANSLGAKAGFPVEQSGPPMRPMWWHFPEHSDADTNERQWMVGNSLLVAPVLDDAVVSHSFYLPSGENWYDLYAPGAEGMQVNSNGQMEFDVNLSRMLVFQRGGSIVPKWERRRRSSAAMSSDPFTLVVALDKDRSAEGQLYLDDGRSYDHESGAYILRHFSYQQDILNAKTVSGGEKDFVGKNAVVERIVILGYGKKAPKKITAGSTEVQFVLAETSGALIVQRVQLSAGLGEWTLNIER